MQQFGHSHGEAILGDHGPHFPTQVRIAGQNRGRVTFSSGTYLLNGNPIELENCREP